ncbi:MAG: DUF3592 domain-containing protein [Anaerolineae bacterium]|jgi:hypothetical protein|nr:DUF3592 domain-containing protein [Anaerolineae bacterium]
MAIFSLLVLLLMFITPVISVLTVVLKFAETRRAVSWPQVRGQVTEVRLLQNGQQYQPEVDIAYAVGETRYTSRQRPVGPNGQSKGSKAWARELSLQFKPGTAVPLYYDPARPKNATLTPRHMEALSPRWQVTSGLMILLSVVMHIIGSRALLTNYLNLSGSSILVSVAITTVVTLLLGAALALLVQETRQPKV